MKRYLGYPVADAESRTIESQEPRNKDATLDPIDAAGTANRTRTDTPNVMSDLGNIY
jgi:hypothetical protein